MAKHDVELTVELNVKESTSADVSNVLVGGFHIAYIERLRTTQVEPAKLYWRVRSTELLWPTKQAAVHYVGALLQNKLNTRGEVGI